MLEKIYSVKNVGGYHKLYTILGMKFKVFTNSICIDKEYKKFVDNLPVQNNKILFHSNTNSYSCNPKYIAEEILKRKLPYELVWVVNNLNNKDSFPKEIKIVLKNTEEEKQAYATSKIWVDNDRKEPDLLVYKKGEQVYIQTWHGSLGIKKTGFERIGTSFVNDKIKLAHSLENSKIDYLISNGAWDTSFLIRVFGTTAKLFEYGHPRNDIFFKNNDELKRELYSLLNIKNNKKIILYAPTFRDDFNIDCYDINLVDVKKALEKKFGEEYAVLVRLHPSLLSKNIAIDLNDSQIIDVTTYPNMQELLSVTDILITDYSSCIFDFILQKNKYGFIYATDSKSYDTNRGLQYPLSETPFPIAETNKEMIENIDKFNTSVYNEKVEKFLKEKGCIEDGMASSKVVNLIEQLVKKTVKNI